MDTIADFYNSSPSEDEESGRSEDETDSRTNTPRRPRQSSLEGDGDAKAPYSPSRKRQKRVDTTQTPIWTRAFAHVDGNWPSHVKIDILFDDAMMVLVDRTLESARRMVGGDVELVAMGSSDGSGLHLSLSRPFVLTFDQIDTFVDALRSALKWRTRFLVALDQALVLVNDERTRSFLALQVVEGADHFVSLLKCVDKCMREYGLQTYYENPIPHVSIASALGDSLHAALSHDQLDQLHREQYQGDEARVVVPVSVVQVTIGNKHFRIPLR